MTTEYSKIKFRDKVSDPCNASSTASKSAQLTTHDTNNNGDKSKARRKIVRDGAVVTVTCLESGRALEYPWGAAVEGWVVAAPQAKAAK